MYRYLTCYRTMICRLFLLACMCLSVCAVDFRDSSALRRRSALFADSAERQLWGGEKNKKHHYEKSPDHYEETESSKKVNNEKGKGYADDDGKGRSKSSDKPPKKDSKKKKKRSKTSKGSKSSKNSDKDKSGKGSYKPDESKEDSKDTHDEKDCPATSCPCFTKHQLERLGGTPDCQPSDGRFEVEFIDESGAITSDVCTGNNCLSEKRACFFIAADNTFIARLSGISHAQDDACRKILADICETSHW